MVYMVVYMVYMYLLLGVYAMIVFTILQKQCPSAAKIEKKDVGPFFMFYRHPEWRGFQNFCTSTCKSYLQEDWKKCKFLKTYEGICKVQKPINLKMRLVKRIPDRHSEQSKKIKFCNGALLGLVSDFHTQKSAYNVVKYAGIRVKLTVKS
jgi:hypothetical protein